MKQSTITKVEFGYTTKKQIQPTCETCRRVVVVYDGEKQSLKCGYLNFKVSKRARCIAFLRRSSQ